MARLLDAFGRVRRGRLSRVAASVGLTRDAALARLDAVRGRIGAPAGPSSLHDLGADRARDGS